MEETSRYPLEEFVEEIATGLSRPDDSIRRRALSTERAAELDEELRRLQSARQVAESESRQYRVS